jgi:uncharacterized lipoprotein YbaY
LPGPVDVSAHKVELLIEDVTRADAPAVTIARVLIPARSLPKAGNRLGPVELNFTPPSGPKRYVVRARLMVGEHLAAGDFLTTTAIPATGARSVELPLTRV